MLIHLGPRLGGQIPDTMEAKTVKTKIKVPSPFPQNWGKVTDFVTTFQTAISQARSGVFQNFQHP